MANAKITFHKCIQDSLEYGSDDEHVVSRVFFTLEIKNKIPSSLHVDIKHAVGSELESERLEVGDPVGYEGPLKNEVFQNAIKKYYRNLVSSKGSGATRKHDITYALDISFAMELDSGSAMLH
jgi:hypothetical protein